ncbi:abortive infection family protein [Rhizobium johnstonii]|uniref:abortive infection family protein n=1 Tax=Rhizobium johnstonii TaxID=3019933 RepID=UPI002DDC9AB8|nr:abortive infection family protein [Rhizobium johnstonii]
MSTRKSIPEEFTENDDLAGEFQVALAEALAVHMSESEWKKFDVRFGLNGRITDHSRFLRSLQWDDPDHEGCVLDLVRELFHSKPAAIIDLVERTNIQMRLRNNHRDLMDVWDGSADPMVVALSHGLEEVADSSAYIDVKPYAARIQASLPGDPHQAIGTTKDLLEATMRTILKRRGHANVEKLDFPALCTQCLTDLGLIGTTAPTTAGEKHLRKIASSAKVMIETANELRNLAGTGHGRVVGEEVEIRASDASLVASNGLVLAAWLIRTAQDAESGCGG